MALEPKQEKRGPLGHWGAGLMPARALALGLCNRSVENKMNFLF